MDVISRVIDETIKTATELQGQGSRADRTFEGFEFNKPILESKAINDLPEVSEANTYKDWNQRFKNAMEQIRPSVRMGLTFIENLKESEVNEYHHSTTNDSQCTSIQQLYERTYSDKYPEVGEHLMKLNRELWAVLKAKAKYKSDADDKIKSVKQGEGLWAYIRVHGWFNQTTEQGMINRMTSIMKPDPCQERLGTLHSGGKVGREVPQHHRRKRRARLARSI